MSPAPSPARTSVAVATPGGHYDILIGTGLLGQGEAWKGLPRAGHAVVVSNPTVHAHHGVALERTLAPLYRRVGRVLLPDGEQYKDWSSLNLIFDHLLGNGCDRRTVLFALGGGVVGDMTGFAAASYMRGVPFVQVPTTLLAQVDSSVGGKTAINHPLGKNMIGAFYQPARVICDMSTLGTLPERELRAGLAEVVKYGPIADDAFLGWIETNLEPLLVRDPEALAHAVRRCCEIKARVVGEDEREAGLRAILNFGHTFGHAIEAALGYGQWLHGEAVACGMAMAADLSVSLGLLTPAYARRLESILVRAGLPVQAPFIEMERWFELMRLDKKSEDGDMRFVLIEAPGKACVRAAPDALVREAIQRRTAAQRLPA